VATPQRRVRRERLEVLLQRRVHPQRLPVDLRQRPGVVGRLFQRDGGHLGEEGREGLQVGDHQNLHQVSSQGITVCTA
jgi:hypothetical protein